MESSERKGANISETIDLFTVYDAILAGGQTRLKLQWMYGILAHLEPLWRHHKEADFHSENVF